MVYNAISGLEFLINNPRAIFKNMAFGWKRKKTIGEQDPEGRRNFLIKSGKIAAGGVIAGSGIGIAAETIPFLQKIGLGLKSAVAYNKEHDFRNPVYKILFDTADRYKKTEKQVEKLKYAIVALDLNDKDAAAKVTIPNYASPYNAHMPVKRMTMKEVGGNDPVYWSVARLVCASGISIGTGQPEYVWILERMGVGPTKGSIVERYAKHLVPAWETTGIMKRFQKIPEFAELFVINDKSLLYAKK